MVVGVRVGVRVKVKVKVEVEVKVKSEVKGYIYILYSCQAYKVFLVRLLFSQRSVVQL
jgi:hypothetical protein